MILAAEGSAFTSAIRRALLPCSLGGGTFALVEVPDPKELMARVATSADDSAFRQLYQHFMPRVSGYLRRCGCQADLAEELAQDVMATVWARANDYDAERAGVSTWIFRVARNRMIDRVRSARRPMPDPSDPVWVGAAPPTPHAALGQARDNAQLRAAMDTLPAEQSSVVHAMFVEGQSLADIARNTELPLGTVKTRARLALQHLRSAMSSQREAEGDHG